VFVVQLIHEDIHEGCTEVLYHIHHAGCSLYYNHFIVSFYPFSIRRYYKDSSTLIFVFSKSTIDVPMKVTKAIIPVAGFGTRFLPQTKAMPKEMLPIVDKPTVQIIVEQFVKAGIKDIILVTGWHKRAIEDHFDTHPELEALLQETGKTKMLEELRSITNLANFIFIRQKGPRGNATPITNALSAIGDTEPYLVSWGDDILISETPMATQLIEAHEKYGGIILGSMKMDKPEDGKKYGFATGKEVEPGVLEVENIIEKPGEGKAPSTYATLAGFLFTPEINPYLKDVVNDIVGREPNYIDALSRLIADKKQKVYAIQFSDAKYYDTGSKLGYLKAVVEFALTHPELKDEFRSYLKEISQ
jgi:UTP--glucose-1-phosphate uridylyltransferase